MRPVPPHGHEEEIMKIFQGIRYRQKQREHDPEAMRPSAEAIRKIHEDEAAAIAADQSFQWRLSIKMRPEPAHGDKDKDIWLGERGILYRHWLRQKIQWRKYTQMCIMLAQKATTTCLCLPAADARAAS